MAKNGTLKFIIVEKCAHRITGYTDITACAERLGVHRDTATVMLPYWENADLIFGQCEVVKSRRGRKAK